MPRVLISPREVQNFEPAYRDVLLNAGWEIVYPPPAEANILTPQELLENLRNIDAVVAGSEVYNADVLVATPQLRVIARVGVGYDSIDTAAATSAGVVVATAPGTNHDSVAEHTFALLLSFTRWVVTRTNAIRAGDWPRHYSKPLRGSTLGIVGLGRIGRAVARRALAFDMRVLGYDPLDAECPSVMRVSLDQLLNESDYVSLHLPVLPDTREMMNHVRFSRMKPGAVLVNTSRGGLIHEGDMLESLRSGQLGGALLDVLQEEPPPQEHPLLKCENVLLTPHAAGVDLQSIADMARSAAEAIVSLRRGEWPAEKIVNPDVKSVFRW